MLLVAETWIFSFRSTLLGVLKIFLKKIRTWNLVFLKIHQKLCKCWKNQLLTQNGSEFIAIWNRSKQNFPIYASIQSLWFENWNRHISRTAQDMKLKFSGFSFLIYRIIWWKFQQNLRHQEITPWRIWRFFKKMALKAYFIHITEGHLRGDNFPPPPINVGSEQGTFYWCKPNSVFFILKFPKMSLYTVFTRFFL